MSARTSVTCFRVPFVAGLQRPQMAMRGGTPILHDTEANAANKEHIRLAYLGACNRLHGGPVVAEAHVPVCVGVRVANVLPPSVRPKGMRSQPDTYKPDLDNVVKLVLDALNGVAWHDDCQVTRIDARKSDRVRGRNPWTEVEVVVGPLALDVD